MIRAYLVFVACVLLALPSGRSLGEEIGDITFERKSAGMGDIPPAVFPHWLHRMQYKCAACHDDLFKMKAGSSEINMDAIQAGKFCGKCHDAKTAFHSHFATCSRCHRQ